MTEEQAGFRLGRGKIDQLFTHLNYFTPQITEKYWEYGRSIYCFFVDFKQAFDSVEKGVGRGVEGGRTRPGNCETDWR